MKKRTGPRTPEQRAKALKSNEQILGWLSRWGFSVLALFLLGLALTQALAVPSEMAVGPHQGGVTMGLSVGLAEAALVLLLGQFLFLRFRRSVQREREGE